MLMGVFSRSRKERMESISLVVGPDEGGTLECRGVKVAIPRGAVLSPQEIHLSVYDDITGGEGSISAFLVFLFHVFA